MTTAEELHAATRSLLVAIQSITVYDGAVPTKPPADNAGRVFPYAVLWPSAGYYPAEIAEPMGGGAPGGTPDGTLEWPVQVTVAAGDLTWCLQAATLVRAALNGVFLTPRTGRLREEPGAPPVARDPDITPVRFFVPLLFRTQGA